MKYNQGYSLVSLVITGAGAIATAAWGTLVFLSPQIDQVKADQKVDHGIVTSVQTSVDDIKDTQKEIKDHQIKTDDTLTILKKEVDWLVYKTGANPKVFEDNNPLP